MSKKEKNKSKDKNENCRSGDIAFDNYYHEVFGERWAKLKASLLLPAKSVEWNYKLTSSYFLDEGSVIAALSIPDFSLDEEKNILDMCAAPGGKSLVLSRMLCDDDSTMICNERSGERKARLVKVLDTHLFPEIRKKIIVTGKDAATWCQHERDAFSRILVDAPCSSERHVLSSPTYLAQWTEARIRNLAQTQWSILSSAFLVLKPGGYLLYATCALSPKENDLVVERLLKKYENAKICQSEIPSEWKSQFLVVGEKTKYGKHILPDTCDGAGPLYFSLIKKSL